MVRVLAVKELETCLDKREVKEFELDEPVDEILMRRLAAGSSLQYFPHFPRPYFRIDSLRHWMVQGLMGDYTLRVVLAAGMAADGVCLLTRLVSESDPPPHGAKP